MIYGIGVDTIAIERIEKSLKNERFERFAFSKRERAAFKRDARKLAGCFAAKEAFSKALGTGVRGFSLDEISVLRDELGKPFFVLEGAAKAVCEAKGLISHLSITNTEAEATAFAVLEEREE